ncbi:integration host factor, actinobacterial type [Janibacter sp. GS2]|uniref:integration host factor, actinobacterial type n=1 Tax=Janibacter sp. GS2 TaxID=3442646 RepID=UPI003EBA6A1B
MPVPPLTPQQRADALSRATAARRQRAEVKHRLKQGSSGIAEVIADGVHDAAIAKFKVSELIESMPGVGRVKAGQIMDDLGIARSRRVRGLGEHQTRALIDHFARA